MQQIKIQDEPETIELAVVTRRGRKRKLTPVVFEKIMVAIEDGDRITPACRRHGISERTVFGLVGKDPESAKRYAAAKALRLQKWHEEWLGEMIDHSKHSPWATGFLLERNFPALYALRPVTRPDTNDTKPIATEIPEDRLKHYRALQLELARQDEAEAAAKQLPNSSE
jgi:hypothetical protein